MPSKTLRSVLGCCIAVVLLAGSFSGGLLVGWLAPLRSVTSQSNSVGSSLATEPTQPASAGSISSGATPAPSTNQPGNPDQSTASSSIEQLFTPFWEAWQIVHDQYVDQPVDNEKLMQGAIRGMMDALGDQHSSYMDPDQYRQANIPMEGEYDGIGAWVDDTTNAYLTITSPMPGSPAEKAGLQSGDQVIAVDGKDVTGTDPKLVLRMVLGPAGSQVTLTILREGATDPIEIAITRAKISVPTSEYRMLDGQIAYIALYDFGETTTDELRKALSELLPKKPTGLILDLRNNGGGYLTTSIEVASEFIPKGAVLYEKYGDGSLKEYDAAPGGLATEIPLVVLVNEGTASASEIVAGAIQDYGRGQLVGTTTYGKGSVQNWVELSNNQGAVRVTIAHWLTPKQRLIHEIGLTPDVEVTLTEADVEARDDKQLKKAIELFSQSQ